MPIRRAGRSLKLAAFAALAGPLDLLARRRVAAHPFTRSNALRRHLTFGQWGDRAKARAKIKLCVLVARKRVRQSHRR